MASTIVLKLVIIGDRSTGKSLLYSRLTGKPVTDLNIGAPPTPSTGHDLVGEIQTSEVPWSSMADPSLSAKVAIWDIVEGSGKAIEMPNAAALASPDGGKFARLTTDVIDPYSPKPSIVVFVVDRNRRVTLDYALKEAAKVPRGTAIAVLVNFRDVEKGKAVTVDETREKFMEVLSKTYSDGQQTVTNGVPSLYPEPLLAVISTSLATNYGLRSLHAFLATPYHVAMRRVHIDAITAVDRALKETSNPVDEDYAQFENRRKERERKRSEAVEQQEQLKQKRSVLDSKTTANTESNAPETAKVMMNQQDEQLLDSFLSPDSDSDDDGGGGDAVAARRSPSPVRAKKAKAKREGFYDSSDDSDDDAGGSSFAAAAPADKPKSPGSAKVKSPEAFYDSDSDESDKGFDVSRQPRSSTPSPPPAPPAAASPAQSSPEISAEVRAAIEAAKSFAVELASDEPVASKSHSKKEKKEKSEKKEKKEKVEKAEKAEKSEKKEKKPKKEKKGGSVDL
jgi:hypothetical protein